MHEHNAAMQFTVFKDIYPSPFPVGDKLSVLCDPSPKKWQSLTACGQLDRCIWVSCVAKSELQFLYALRMKGLRRTLPGRIRWPLECTVDEIADYGKELR